MSSAPGAGAVLSIWILLTVLLALFIAVILSSPPWTPQHASDEAASQPGPPEPAAELPVAPLPRRMAGESGWVAPANGELKPVPDVTQLARVSGGPPWAPAPKPRGIPPWDMP